MTPALRAAILRWYRRNRRDLPWRRTRDPYAIWVSEVMLQQTRVEAVIPFYERFLARFPTVRALAAAREASVLAAWSGLGYYRRARNMKEAAGVVVREHAGRLPEEPEALRALPGIGVYTASAIASVAFDRPAAAVDGNVIRVLARLAGLRGRRDAGSLRREVASLADQLARGPSPGDWTQALMELGALVCLPREPRCAACPAAGRCVAYATGDPSRYPEAAPPRTPPAERHVLLVARRGPRVFLVPDGERGDRGWALPAARVAEKPRSAGRGVREEGESRRFALDLARRVAKEAEARGPIGTFRHRTYARDLVFEVWEMDPGPSGPAARAASRAIRGAPRAAPKAIRGPSRSARARGRWVTPEELGSLPVRSPTIKALKYLRAHEERDKRRNIC